MCVDMYLLWSMCRGQVSWGMTVSFHHVSAWDCSEEVRLVAGLFPTLAGLLALTSVCRRLGSALELFVYIRLL